MSIEIIQVFCGSLSSIAADNSNVELRIRTLMYFVLYTGSLAAEAKTRKQLLF